MAIDPHSPPVRQSLAETIECCSTQTLTATPEEPEDFKRRRGLLGQANNLLRKAHELHKDAYETDEWRRGMDLLREADPGSLTLLDSQLRTPVLYRGESIGETLSESVREAMVQGVIRKRSQLLAERGIFDAEKVILGRAGRILIYNPAENVADGASQVGSNGFFDENDAPPWDTWFHYSESTLFCWVPSLLESLVEDGINANPVDCIHWADEGELKF